MSATLDPRGHDSELEQALCVLAAQPRSKNGWLTATDISRILRHDFGMGVHWRTVATCLDKSKDCVTRRKRNRRWWYQILDKGNELVTKPRSSVTLVDPAKAVENLTTLHDFAFGAFRLRACL